MHRRVIGMAALLAAMGGGRTSAEQAVIDVSNKPRDDGRSQAHHVQPVRISTSRPMSPAELYYRGRQRRRAQQTHPGKRGRR